MRFGTLLISATRLDGDTITLNGTIWPTIGGMEDLFLIIAILATVVTVFRVLAREGVLGLEMQNIVFQTTQPRAAVVLACLFWAAWYCAADM